MSSPSSPPQPGPGRPGRFREWWKRAAGLTIATVILGWAFGWAHVRSYEPERTAGFWTGMLHGAVMPAALPGLLFGKDVPIFAPSNTGRAYKLGYVFGINCSGIVFFGLTFRQNKQPAGSRKAPDAPLDTST